MTIKLANNAVSKLAAPILAGDVSLSVTAGDGAKFPTLAAGETFPATLIRASDNAVEIVSVTARAVDAFTIVRAQEGTTALAMSAGDRIELRLTNSSLSAFITQIINSLTHNYRNYIDGLTWSTAGASTSASIAAGEAMDSTNAQIMTLAASITKTTAAWVVGTAGGGLDTGVIANSTWYAWYLIRRPDTGVVDVIFSTNFTAPTLPANYTQYRRIAFASTNGSGQWVKVYQNGDEFFIDSPNTYDINTGTLSTGWVNYALPLPTGIKLLAKLECYISNAATGVQARVDDPDKANANPIGASALIVPSGGGYGGAALEAMTNTSAQIKAIATSASTTFRASLVSWVDRRGRG